MHSARECVCVCVQTRARADQTACTLRVCVHVCVCSNKPVSQDTQNLISWRQLTVFKNRLLPMTFPSPLFSDSKPAHSLLSYEPNSKDGPGCQWEAVLLARKTHKLAAL